MTQAYPDRKAVAKAVIALGANVAIGGQTLAQAIEAAIALIDRPDCRLLHQSRMFDTPCFPVGAGPDYVNAVAAFQTSLTAPELLTRLHSVEQTLGRARTQRWGSRTMDLDLLALDDAICPDPATFWYWHDMAADEQKLRAPETLVLPHPRLDGRAFVLIPLMDIAPEWRHPVLGQTVAQMADALPEADKLAVRPVAT